MITNYRVNKYKYITQRQQTALAFGIVDGFVVRDGDDRFTRMVRDYCAKSECIFLGVGNELFDSAAIGVGARFARSQRVFDKQSRRGFAIYCVYS